MQAGWRSLTDQARSLWNNYAKEKPVFNRSGEKHPLSGHSLWMKYQYIYQANDLPFLTTPANYQDPPLSAELLKNGDFIDGSFWTLNPDSSISGGAFHGRNLDVAKKNSYQSSTGFLKPYLYRIILDYSNYTGLVRIFNGGPPTWNIVNGTYVYWATPENPYQYFMIQMYPGATIDIESVSLKRIYI